MASIGEYLHPTNTAPATKETAVATGAALAAYLSNAGGCEASYGHPVLSVWPLAEH